MKGNSGSEKLFWIFRMSIIDNLFLVRNILYVAVYCIHTVPSFLLVSLKITLTAGRIVFYRLWWRSVILQFNLTVAKMSININLLPPCIPEIRVIDRTTTTRHNVTLHVYVYECTYECKLCIFVRTYESGSCFLPTASFWVTITCMTSDNDRNRWWSFGPRFSTRYYMYKCPIILGLAWSPGNIWQKTFP